MNNEKLAERELIEAAESVVARWYTPKWKDEPHTAVFIERLRAALAAKSAIAQPAQQASAGSIDCDTFWVHVANCRWAQPGEDYRKKSAALVAHIDSRPRQAVQHVSLVPRLDYDLLKLALEQAQERLRQADEFIARQEDVALAAIERQASAEVRGASLSMRLREHNDPRLYREADILMSEAADAIDAQQAPDTVRDDALEALQSIANGIPNPVKFAELSIRALKSTAPKLADGEVG